MPELIFDNGKYPLGHGEGGGVGNAFQTIMARIDWRDVTATGTFTGPALPAGAFVVRCYFAVETTWTSDGSATMEIRESTGSNVSYISATDGVKANLTAGSVIGSPSGDGADILSNVASHNDAFDTAARTIDFVTGTAAWTAGVGVLIVEYVIIPQ